MKNIIIILNFNDCKNTLKLLNKIKEYKVFSKIIIVDNCSTDDSYSVLKAYQNNKILVIKTKINSGYAVGNNYGAFYAIKNYNPKFIFFANPDIIFEENAISKITKVLDSNENYAIGTVLVETGYNVWDQCGYIRTLSTLLLLCFYLHKRRIRKKIMINKTYAIVGVVEGSFFGIKADVFDKVNGFDERTFLYYEENILSMKLDKLNLKEIVVLTETYQHIHSGSISKVYKSKVKAFYNYKNSILIYAVHYLNIGNIRKKILMLFYYLGLFERIFYDFVNKLEKFVVLKMNRESKNKKYED